MLPVPLAVSATLPTLETEPILKLLPIFAGKILTTPCPMPAGTPI